MGNVSSSHPTTRRRMTGAATDLVPIPARVVAVDGRLEEFRRRTTAEDVLSGHPGCYLCSSDTMKVNSTAPQLSGDYVLQFGQIYFLMPLSELLTPLALKDMCALAIKASCCVNIGNSPSSFPGESTRSGRAPVNEPRVRPGKQGPYVDFWWCPKLTSLRKI